MVEQLDENALNIYTDGSSYPSPRVGGTGLLFIVIDEHGNPIIQEEAPSGWQGATNNQMELEACIQALRMALGNRGPDLSGIERITIWTDSLYVSDNFRKALFEWPRKRWRTRTGAPVLNVDRWRELVRLVSRARQQGLRVDMKWVKGHRKNPYNKQADRLAKRSAKSPLVRPGTPKRVRRKKSPRQVEMGSVPMVGQVVTIRIVTDEYLRSPHRCYRYQYEVMDKQSPYDAWSDYATSDLILGAGHTYRVRFNDDSGNPRIEEVFTEVSEPLA